MDMKEAVAMVARLTAAVAAAQHNATLGRKFNTYPAKAVGAANKLLKELTGQEPTEEELAESLKGLGET